MAATDSTFFIASQKGVLYKFDSSPYLGVEDDHLEVSIFPNPANGRVVIEGIDIAVVQIYNALGQLMKSEQSTNVIGLEGFPKGVYFISITDKKGCRYVHKLVKE